MENREWRASVVLPAAIEDAVLEMRNREEFKRASLSEILRVLLTKGLKAYGIGEDGDPKEGDDE